MPFAFRRTTAVALGAACVAFLVVAVVAAHHAAPSEVSPVVPRGSWNGLWIAGVVGALAAYVAGAAVAWREGVVLGGALAIAVCVQCVTLAAPLLLSKDSYLYWSEARTVAVHHASPYRTSPDDFPADPSLPWVSEEWRNEPAPYGPTWEAVALVPGSAAGSSHSRAQLAYRAFSVLGVLVALAVVTLGTRSGAAVALLGWNPLVALHFGGGGHNDGWLVALLALGVLARRRAAGGGAWPLAAAFKPVGLVLLPLDLAASRIRRPRAFWLGLAAAALLVLAISAPLWGLNWLHSALVGVHGASPLGGVHVLVQLGLRHRYAVAIGALVFAAVYVVLFAHAWRTGRARLSLAASALCLTTSLLRPWYGLWPIALAAAEEDTGAAAVAVALSIYLILGDAVRF